MAKTAHWLVRMSTAIYQHWQKKNARQRHLAVRPPAPTIILSGGRKGARQRSGQRERVRSPEATPLARGLGTAQVPKSKKRLSQSETQPPFCFQAAIAGVKLAAFRS